MHSTSARVNTASTPYYRVMHDSKSQDAMSWRIGLVLFTITKSWRISQSALRSLKLIAFQLAQEQDKIDNPNHSKTLAYVVQRMCFSSLVARIYVLLLCRSSKLFKIHSNANYCLNRNLEFIDSTQRSLIYCQ